MPKFQRPIDHNLQRAINAADGTAATDLTTLQQVQQLIRGLTDWKDDVRATTTGNVTLSAPQTIDGVALVAGDRVLVKNQTTASENGIYQVNAGAWTRTTDADSNAEVSRGMTVTVLEGTNKGTGSAQGNPITYTLTTSGAIVLGTTALSFSTVGGAGGTTYTAGVGIDVTGSVIDIEAGYRARGFAANCVATTNPQSFAHGFGTADLVGVVVKEGTTQVYPDITWDATNITVDWGSAPTAAQYRVAAVAVV